LQRAGPGAAHRVRAVLPEVGEDPRVRAGRVAAGVAGLEAGEQLGGRVERLPQRVEGQRGLVGRDHSPIVAYSFSSCARWLYVCPAKARRDVARGSSPRFGWKPTRRNWAGVSVRSRARFQRRAATKVARAASVSMSPAP